MIPRPPLDPPALRSASLKASYDNMDPRNETGNPKNMTIEYNIDFGPFDPIGPDLGPIWAQNSRLLNSKDRQLSKYARLEIFEIFWQSKTVLVTLGPF